MKSCLLHYEILEEIGRGGMGVVYKARDTHLDRLVAIKVLPADKVADPDRKLRFVREAKAASALNHPNIITVYEINSDQSLDFIVMEYIDGKTLDKLIPVRGLRPSEALKYAVQIADAMSKAHGGAILHRDLKPSNVMITDDGRVKILDFGLAKLATPSEASAAETDTVTARPLTQEGTVVGTPAYMSPEQAEGRRLDRRSDIFSFGSVLYELVTGQKPFTGDSRFSTLSKILNEEPRSPSVLAPDIPPELEKLILRCLRKDPARRYQTMADLKVALEDQQAEPISVTQAQSRPSRRKWAWAATATVLLAAASFFVWRAVSGKSIDSLAVLPFVNVGGDPNTEYLSDGITENLINSLSQLPKLRVVPRSRVFRYKGREADTEKIGQELNVRALLTGRVVQRGDSLNIQTELVDVAGDSQLWGRQYNRKFSEIIPVQEEIAKEVSAKLGLRPTIEEQRRLAKRYTENPEAHQLYLKGRYYWNRRTTEALRRAAEELQKAIDKDAGYALAWAGLADCYAVYNAFGAPRESAPKAKEAAIKALALDDTLAEPHATLGYVKSTYDWDWPGAEREFKRAIELNPNYATAHSWYGILLEAMGRPDEAVAEAKRAQEADPLSLVISTAAGRTFYFARRFDQAIEQLRKSIEMDPNFHLPRAFLGMTYQQLARFQEATVEFQKAWSLSGGEPGPLAGLGHAYAVWGKRADAQKVLAELKDLSKRRYVAPYDIALIYVGLGDKSQGLEWLEKAHEDRSFFLTWIKVEPRLDSLRGEPRFQDLLRRMGLGS